MCGPSGCGKGASNVMKWYHSQCDTDNKKLWFCCSCYDKEVRIPQFPQPSLDVPSQTVSLTSRRLIFYFSQSLELADEAGRTCGSCPSIKTCKWHPCDGVPDGWTCHQCHCKEESYQNFQKEYHKGYIRPKKQKKA